jgi:hypothetical protein
MSDPNNPPPGNPYGDPPPSNPYGQPAQPPAYGQQPYGQQPYGQQPYGATAYGAGDPDKRPGTVTAASLITIVFSVLVFALLVVAIVALAANRDEILDELWQEIRDQGTAEDLTREDLDDAWAVVLAVPVIGMIWAVIAIITASLAMKRHNWARIITVISAAMTALLSLLGIASVVSVITLIAAVAVIVLYFVGGANQWYARKRQAPPLPTGTTQPWG